MAVMLVIGCGVLFGWTLNSDDATRQEITPQARQMFPDYFVPDDYGTSVRIPGAHVVLADGENVSVGAFLMDQYEVTNGQYEEYVQKSGVPPPSYWQDAECPEELRAVPVVGVSYNDAKAYAFWRRKRLPTEHEWKLASGIYDGQSWPWGDWFDPQRCNTKASGMECAVWIGAFERDRSLSELYDMAGNVAEWTASTVEDRRDYCVVYGYSWRDSVKPGGLVDSRAHVLMSARSSSIGFRCVADGDGRIERTVYATGGSTSG